MVNIEKLFYYLVKITKVIQGFLFFILGIILSLNFGWYMKTNPLQITDSDFIEIANYLNISVSKAKYIFENIAIAFTVLIVICTWKLTILLEPKRQSMIFQFIFEISVCGVLILFIIQLTNSFLTS